MCGLPLSTHGCFVTIALWRSSPPLLRPYLRLLLLQLGGCFLLLFAVVFLCSGLAIGPFFCPLLPCGGRFEINLSLTQSLELSKLAHLFWDLDVDIMART